MGYIDKYKDFDAIIEEKFRPIEGKVDFFKIPNQLNDINEKFENLNKKFEETEKGNYLDQAREPLPSAQTEGPRRLEATAARSTGRVPVGNAANCNRQQGPVPRLRHEPHNRL